MPFKLFIVTIILPYVYCRDATIIDFVGTLSKKKPAWIPEGKILQDLHTCKFL